MKQALALLALCGALVAGCRGEAALPRGPAIIDITMREYRFERDPNQRIAEGRVVFRVRNAGQVEHQLIVLDIPESLPRSFDQQLRSPKRQAALPLAILSNRRPGRTGAFAVDLPAGRYGIACFLKAADGKSHAVKGMSSEFRVRRDS